MVLTGQSASLPETLVDALQVACVQEKGAYAEASGLGDV